MRQPITGQDFFFQDQISRIVEEQQETNELLQQLLNTLKPPVKEVEKVDIVRNVGTDKRKRR